MTQHNLSHGANRTGAIFSVIGLAVIIWIFLSNGTFSVPQLFHTPRSVVYRVTGTATKASLTYQTSSGIAQETTQSLPWEKSLTMNAGGFVSISAQAESNGTVTTEVVVDGEKIKSTTSTGFAAIASCDGTLP